MGTTRVSIFWSSICVTTSLRTATVREVAPEREEVEDDVVRVFTPLVFAGCFATFFETAETAVFEAVFLETGAFKGLEEGFFAGIEKGNC